MGDAQFSFGSYAELFAGAAEAAKELAAMERPVDSFGDESIAQSRDRLIELVAAEPVPELASLHRAEVRTLVDSLLEVGRKQGRREARSPESLYVLTLSVGADAMSTDLELLKKQAEDKTQHDASEFKWERDKYIGWTERLVLHHMSKTTGRWNKSGFYIDTVPVLHPEENA